ncbi:MAG: hypothetical protein DRI26_05955 [Chloroflexi bacterium]|mgnify:CR=1 FL=1|nr:MAG: hypothetical protein DRI26_05955 [Chloroflexota bacterium]
MNHHGSGRHEQSILTNETLRKYLFLTALSGLLVIIHIGTGIVIRKLGLHLPGISGLIWMPLLVMGKKRWRTRISGTYMASVSSAVVLSVTPMLGIGGMGGAWIAPFLRYGIPGAALDVFWPLAERLSGRFSAYLIAAATVAALSHAGKAFFVLVSCYLRGKGLPADPLMLFLLHFAFGAAGGVMGTMMGALGFRGKNRNS